MVIDIILIMKLFPKGSRKFEYLLLHSSKENIQSFGKDGKYMRIGGLND